jgi:hypothetical protein
MTTYKGPLPMTASTAFKKIESSFKSRGKKLAPSSKQNGEAVHKSLSGVTFNYWTSLDEEVCFLEIKDGRTRDQGRGGQWIEYISSQVFKNPNDAKTWLEREIGKYCNVMPKKY